MTEQREGRPQGGLKSQAGRASYWRMNYESAIGALADLIAENTENVEAGRKLAAGLRVEAERLRRIDVHSVALWMENEADLLDQRYLPGQSPVPASEQAGEREA